LAFHAARLWRLHFSAGDAPVTGNNAAAASRGRHNRFRVHSLADEEGGDIKPFRSNWRIEVAKKAAKKRISRREYTAADVKLLKAHSKARTPVSKLTKLMKRSEGSLRQKALKLGIGLGHQR
jgi:hypothetical protein